MTHPCQVGQWESCSQPAAIEITRTNDDQRLVTKTFCSGHKDAPIADCVSDLSNGFINAVTIVRLNPKEVT